MNARLAFVVLGLLVGLLAAPALASALEVGDEAPAWSLKSIRDMEEEISLESLKGKYVLLDFWATWCGPCAQAAETVLNPMWEALGEREDEWVLVSIGCNWRDTAEAQLEHIDETEYGWTFVFDEDGSVAEAYDVTGIPTIVLVNPEGEVEGAGHVEVAAQLGALLVPPPEDRTEGAEALPLSNGGIAGETSIFGEITYSFTAEEAGTYIIETSGEEGVDTMIFVYDADGETAIAENDDINTDGGIYLSRVELELEAGTTIYVTVKGYGGAAVKFGLTVAKAG